MTNIGKNFLFKALFAIEEAVPGAQRACSEPGALCPRCRMFGMAGRDESPGSPGGFRGRFRSAALVAPDELERIEYSSYKVPGTEIKVELPAWKSAGGEICRQWLLPIQGPPKANKRDASGYFDRKTGEIRGAKFYRHARCDIGELVREIDRKPLQGKMAYSHNLRNYAVACNPGTRFTGVVGAENCTPGEVAALVLVLHSPDSRHGFKIGLGKAFGMGSIRSSISRAWVRTAPDYKWRRYDSLDDFLSKNEAIRSQKENLATRPGLPGEPAGEGLLLDENLKVPPLEAVYPPKGSDYWKKIRPPGRS